MLETSEQSEIAETSDLESTSEGVRPRLKSKARLLVFAALVVVAECLAAYFLIPAVPDASAMSPLPVEHLPPDELFSGEGSEKEEKQAISEELLEVDLGEFTVSSYQPVTATTLRIDFHLFGTVAAADAEEFRKLLETNLHRVRDEVIVIMRSSDLEDVTDAGLGLIKRKILEKTNHSLGKPYLQAVVFSDFSFIEQ